MADPNNMSVQAGNKVASGAQVPAGVNLAKLKEGSVSDGDKAAAAKQANLVDLKALIKKMMPDSSEHDQQLAVIRHMRG